MKMRYALVFMACCACMGCHRSEQQPSAKELSRRISTIRPWDVEGNYSKSDWARLIAVAKFAQTANADTVVEALDLFAKRRVVVYTGMYTEDSKVLLLLKIMFDWPTHAPNKPPFTGGGPWVRDGADYNFDGTVNLDFPVAWKDGKPFLVRGWRGYEGWSWDGPSEYRQALNTMKYRKLTED